MNVNLNKQRAWKLFTNDELDDARQLCEEIRDANVADAEVFYLLGCCYQRNGQYTNAVVALEKSLKIKPGKPAILLVLGKVLTKLGRLEEAIDRYKSILDVKPDMFKAHHGIAKAFSLLKSVEEAKLHYKKAIKLQPEKAAPHIGLASLVWSVERNLDVAIKHINIAIELYPKNISHRCILGDVLMDAQRIDESFVCFREALKISPENARVIGGLARLHNLKGQYKESMEYIDLLRSKKVYNTMAAVAFTSICKHLNNCEEAVAYAKKSLEGNQVVKDTDEALHMHIARTLDSLEQYDEAWQYFSKGNKITEGLYDTVEHQLRTEKMIDVFSHFNMMGLVKSSIDSKRPIFIVGMPRSGTSLVEQILSAHPDVCGGGELTHMSDIRAMIIQQASHGKSWPDCARELKQENLNSLAKNYLDRLDGISESAKRVTDKMPHNFFELGLIQMLFPQAHIIHCNRDPRDTCLSIYFQNFLDGHDYSRNIYHIGAHYHQYLKLMAHWRSHLSMSFLDVQYEELVSNPEVVVRQMLKHCNLEWHSGCLDFYKVKRLVHTASYDQVRQPMYTKSVHRWRHYEQYLSDLDEGLERGF